MLVLFPFEKTFYQNHGMNAQCVGHPLKDIIQIETTKIQFITSINLDSSKKALGLFPGSREQEVQHILPTMLQTYHSVKSYNPDIQAAIGCVPTLPIQLYQNILDKFKIKIPLVSNHTYDLMKHCDLALVASGTATLETALLGSPLIVIYKTSALTYWIGKYLIHLKNISLVNIVAEKQIVPEFIQHQATATEIAKEALSLLYDNEKITNIKSNLKLISKRLGEKGAVERTADELIAFIKLNPK